MVSSVVGMWNGRRRRWLRPAALVLWCLVIFAFSAQPHLTVSDTERLDLIIRKGAHMAVFGVLVLLATSTVREFGASGKHSVAIGWAATLAYACSDEWHQTFVSGRRGSPVDVAIDMMGATLALGVAGWLHRIRRLDERQGT